MENVPGHWNKQQIVFQSVVEMISIVQEERNVFQKANDVTTEAIALTEKRKMINYVKRNAKQLEQNGKVLRRPNGYTCLAENML